MYVYSRDELIMQYAFCATATRLRMYSAWLSCCAACLRAAACARDYAR